MRKIYIYLETLCGTSFTSCSVQRRNTSDVEWHSNMKDTPIVSSQRNNRKKSETVKIKWRYHLFRKVSNRWPPILFNTLSNNFPKPKNPGLIFVLRRINRTKWSHNVWNTDRRGWLLLRAKRDITRMDIWSENEDRERLNGSVIAVENVPASRNQPKRFLR